MPSPYSPPKSLEAVPSARVCWPAYANAALWGLGGGFATTTLAVYLIYSLGAGGLTASALIAAPQFVGLARLLAGWFCGDGSRRKWFCVIAYLTSGLVLTMLPLATLRQAQLIGLCQSLLARWSALPKRGDSFSSREAALAIVVAVWCFYQLLEYLGTVALWAWLRDLVPLERRGAFLGRRELWLEGGRALGVLGCAAVTGLKDPRTLEASIYATMGTIGAVAFMLAAIPLCFMAARPYEADGSSAVAAASRFRVRDFLAIFLDRRLSRLLLYGCWFSFFNGATQVAQNLVVVRVLGIALAWMLAFRVGMTAGQAVVSPWLGRLMDRIGYRAVLFVCQAIVAASMFGYLLATESSWWLVGLAWAGWIAYAGINIALPGLLLKLSPPDKAAASIAGYFAITGLCYGLSIIAGTFVFESIRGHDFLVMGRLLDRYQYSFYVAIVTRILGCFFIYAIDEPPPAKTGWANAA